METNESHKNANSVISLSPEYPKYRDTVIYCFVILFLIVFLGGGYLLTRHINKYYSPKNILAVFYLTRGKASIEKGDYDGAIANYNKAIDINPRYAMAYYNRGRAYNIKGQYDQVISDCNKAIEINPRYAEAYNNRGLAYFSKKEYDNAWNDVKKAPALGYKIHPNFLETLS